MARPETRWMPIDWAHYWRDTGHLSALEHGAYLNLIGAYWTASGPLHNNEAWLQRLSKCSAKEWKSVAATILAFFEIRGDKLHHKRIDHELATAKERYERRSSAGKAGGEAKAKQKASNATAEAQANEGQCHTHTTLVQSPNGDKHPSDVLDAKAKRPTRIPPDWMPSHKDTSHARDQGLDAPTIAAIAEQFRDHWTGASKNATSPDWSAKWRTWVKNHIGYHGTGTWPRPDAGRPTGHQAHRGSVIAARDSILAKAGIRRGDDSVLRPNGGTWATGNSAGDDGFGEVIDADFRERSVGPVDGNEGFDATASGADDIGYRGADGGVPQSDCDLPGGRSAVCLDETAEREPLVAGVAGTAREAGDTRLPQTDDADGLEIPGFLRRTSAA